MQTSNQRSSQIKSRKKLIMILDKLVQDLINTVSSNLSIYRLFYFQVYKLTIIKFGSCMDTSDFDSVNNRAILEIQRAQRILDQTESKMRRLKKDKESSSKLATNIDYTTPLPDIKQYISCLLSCDNEDGTQQSYRDGPAVFHNNIGASSKKNEKIFVASVKKNDVNQETSTVENALRFDLKTHTQEQLEKSQMVHINRIQTMYNEQLGALDAKADQLIKDRQKIKRDKVLLLRDNQQIENKIADLREAKPKFPVQSPIIEQLQSQIIKLQKKLDKIEVQNKKIRKRKQQLQANMMVCIRNSKDELETNIARSQIRSNKSKSHIINRCQYH